MNTKLPDFLSFDTGTMKTDNIPKNPSNLKSSWGDGESSSFLGSTSNLNLNSNVSSFTTNSKPINSTFTSTTSNVTAKNWDLPTDLTRAYTTKEVITTQPHYNSDSNGDIIESIEEEEEQEQLELELKLNEHLPKYSEAEYKTLLEIAIRESEQKAKDTCLKKELEWNTEREQLTNEVSILKTEQILNHTNSNESSIQITTINEELLLMKMQTKALTHRLQVCNM